MTKFLKNVHSKFRNLVDFGGRILGVSFLRNWRLTELYLPVSRFFDTKQFLFPKRRILVKFQNFQSRSLKNIECLLTCMPSHAEIRKETVRRARERERGSRRQDMRGTSCGAIWNLGVQLRRKLSQGRGGNSPRPRGRRTINWRGRVWIEACPFDAKIELNTPLYAGIWRLVLWKALNWSTYNACDEPLYDLIPPNPIHGQKYKNSILCKVNKNIVF